jgi:hypothetical protein
MTLSIVNINLREKYLLYINSMFMVSKTIKVLIMPLNIYFPNKNKTVAYYLSVAVHKHKRVYL